MAIQLQLRRGTTEELDNFTGAEGEVVVDTLNSTLFVHDGITLGGHELAKANLSNVEVTKSLTPKLSAQIDLGTPTNLWRDLYLDNSININGIRLSAIDDGIRINTGSSSESFELTKGSVLQQLHLQPSTYGSATKIPKITINEYGVITSVIEQDNIPDLPNLLNEELQYGSPTKIPVIKVNRKGLITQVAEQDSVAILPDILSEEKQYGSNTKFPVVTVNKKGLVSLIEERDILQDVVTAGEVGSSTQIPVLKYNTKGLLTEVSSVNIPTLAKGFFVANDSVARESLQNKESGMIVLTKDDNTLWQLKSDLSTWQKYVPRSSKTTIEYNLADLPSFEFVDFELEMGNSVIVYSVLVTHACMLEVFENSSRNQSNPYRFIATDDHLEDDGSTLLSDGTILRGRRYHIWSSTSAINKIYCRLTNVSGTSIQNFKLTVVYTPIEVSLAI
jgi:hypothetical protein